MKKEKFKQVNRNTHFLIIDWASKEQPIADFFQIIIADKDGFLKNLTEMTKGGLK